MIVKTTIIGIACCALVAPLAFGKDSQTVTFEKGVTVAGAAPVTTVERGEAARTHLEGAPGRPVTRAPPRVAPPA